MKSKMWSSLRSSNAGQTLFEMVLALGVGILVITAIVKMSTLSVKNSTFAKTQSQATRYAQEAIDWLRYQRNLDPLGFATRTNKTWCLQSLGWPGNDGSCSPSSLIDKKFKREVYLTPQTIGGAVVTEAQLTVSWSDSTGKHQSSLTTRLSDNTGSLVINPSPLPPPPPPPPSNLLANGSFEDGFNNWSAEAYSGADVSTQGVEKKSGNLAARLETSGNSQSEAFISNPFPYLNLKGNTKYCISLWIKKERADTGSYFKTEYTQSYLTSFLVQTTSTDWQKLSAEFTTISSETTFQLLLDLKGGNTQAWVDDISLTEAACQ